MRLVIETATAACSVALIDDRDRLIAERHEIVGRGHAERLVTMIAELPGQGRAEAILVDCGPGSFTGVRVGLAAARALAFAWAVPITGFSSLALIAAAAPDEAGEFGAAIAGGHGEFYVQRFATRPFRAIGAFASLPPAAARAILGGRPAVGPGAAALDGGNEGGISDEAWPRAANAFRLPAALADLPPTPLYGRAPDARPPG